MIPQQGLSVDIVSSNWDMRPDLNATETGVFFFMEDLIIARSFFKFFF